jgi:hypothetical protein
VALNAPAFQFVADPTGLAPQFIRGSLIGMLALTYLFFMLRVAGGRAHGASAEDIANREPSDDPPGESDKGPRSQSRGAKGPKASRGRPSPQPAPAGAGPEDSERDDAPAATPASTTSQFFAFAWPAVLVVTVGVLAWQTVEFERRGLQLAHCQAEASMTAPRAATIAPAPKTATDVEALSPLAQPKRSVDTPAARQQPKRTVGSSRRPP